MDIERGEDDDGRRWYTDGADEYMSVTTVLDFLDEDTGGLDWWKSQNDGEGDNAHWQHLFWYTRHRGTLCHYQALKKFEDHFESEDMWSKDEASSMKSINEGPQISLGDVEEFEAADATTNMDDILYSVLVRQNTVSSRDQYEHLLRDNTELIDVAMDDMSYFVDTFATVCEELGITNESVLAVERFLLNGTEGYGGQADLLYEDPGGNVVVADLKTGSFRQKHRLQSVAYAKAMEEADVVEEVDRVEVIRIHPDKELWQVHSHTVPSHVEHLYDESEPETSNYTDAHWFEDKYGDFSYEDLDDMWSTFQRLTEKAHETVSD